MTDLHDTLRRLASQFVARDIMKPAERLLTAATVEQAQRLLAEHPRFDVIPVTSGDRILSFLERGQSRPKGIQTTDMVCAGTPIPDTVDSLSKRPFFFVIGRHEIIGLLHFSDLNDPVVKLPYFVLLEGVERHLSDDLKDLVTDQILPDVIHDSKRVNTLREKMRRLEADHAERDWVTLMYFREILEAAVYFNKLSLPVPDIEQLSAVRTRVAHAATDELVETHGDVKRLSRVSHLCTTILLNERAA